MTAYTSIKPVPREMKISPYAGLLLELSNQLTEAEYSQMKLALCVDSYIKPNRLATIQNAADLLQFMNSKKIITRTDLKMLCELLKGIGREDLRSKVMEYENLHIVRIPESVSHAVKCIDDECARSQKFDEHSENLCCDEDDMPSSQDSMKSLSDDDKLLRAGIGYPDKPTMFELDDVHMSSQGSN